MADMRLGIVAEFTDRASQRLTKLLRANQRLEQASRASANLARPQLAAQTRLAAATDRMARLMVQVRTSAAGISAPIIQAGAAMARFSGQIATAIRKAFSLRAALDRARQGASLMGQGLGRIATGATVAGGLALGAGGLAAGAANMVIGPAAQMEAYMVQLESLEGSGERAKTAMGWITDFAAKTPLELPQVVEAYRQLKTFGIDPTNGSLQAMVDTMAMSGGGAENLSGIVLAVGQAWTKGKLQGEEALQLLERGVPVWDLLSKATGKSAAELQDLASKGKLGRDVIAKLVELMGERATGASEKLSRTWDGMVSNMSDMWFKFRLMIADAGLFDWAKDKLQGLLTTFNQMEADGTLQAWAEDISRNIIATLEAIWTFGTGLWNTFLILAEWLSYAADMLGGWNNLAMVLIALPLASTIMGVVTGVVQLVSGFMLLASGIAALSLPLVAVLAGVALLAAGAWYVYQNWDQVTAWFGAAWDWVKSRVMAAFDGILAAAAGAWSWFKENLSWHPLALIANNWDQLSGYFSELWAGIKARAAEAWAGIKALFVFEWPDFKWPEFKWPDLTLPIPRLPDGFSDWVASAFDRLVGVAEDGWSRLKAIFTAMQEAAAGLGAALSDVVGGAVDAARSAFDALKGARGVDRIYGELSALANTSSALNPFGSDFDQGYALTEALQAGQMSLATYREELAKVVAGGGAFAETAQKMLDAAARLDAFSAPGSTAQPAGPGVPDPSAMAATEAMITAIKVAAAALPGIVATAVSAARTHLEALDFSVHGARMMDTIAAGMRARAHVVVTEMRAMTQALRDHLPSSPAKVGPLSDIHRLKFSETMAQSIRPGPMVDAMRRTAAATLAAATLGAPALPAMASASPQPLATSQSAVVRGSGSGFSGPGASQSGGGSSIQITYSPQVTIAGGAAADRDALLAVLNDHADDLVALIRRRLDEDGRLEF
ncbi:tape measure protein [Pannonibacter sp. SL95]|uniref:tape measure protein n=1 Tax=Pannonibacter sp. SL95 TaxID=2995153 RepID=UPI00227477C8|nr:tape measure protein [Pannonibacter sp. SL95]MCY1706417.1 tape measure protein [Pannonibacter sp. SL95]